MKIVRLEAENFKRLRCVSIKPDGSVIQITGKNAQGKSSVLDAIYAALAGGKGNALPDKPIRAGEEKARIRLELGDIVVTRKFGPGGSTLVVETAAGARFPSPQRLLDDMIGAISFDPLQFVQLDRAAQYDTLRKLVKLDVDIDALKGQNATAFEQRAELNRDAKKLRAQAAGIVVPSGLPEDPIDVASLTQELAAAGATNTEIGQRQMRRDKAREEAEAMVAVAQEKRARAKRLRAEADDLDKAAAEDDATRDDLTKKLNTAPALPPLVDTAALVERIAAAGIANKGIEQRTLRARLEADAQEKEDWAERLTNDMTARDLAMTRAIEKAEMPVPGLSLGDLEITLNGVPFSQASDAERIRTSVAIAMATNPKLRVLRIKHGSDLDEDNLAMLQSMADAADYQIWIERVDSSGKVGVVMEDGAVKGAPVEKKE